MSVLVSPLFPLPGKTSYSVSHATLQRRDNLARHLKSCRRAGSSIIYEGDELEDSSQPSHHASAYRSNRDRGARHHPTVRHDSVKSHGHDAWFALSPKGVRAICTKCTDYFTPHDLPRKYRSLFRILEITFQCIEPSIEWRWLYFYGIW